MEEFVKNNPVDESDDDHNYWEGAHLASEQDFQQVYLGRPTEIHQPTFLIQQHTASVSDRSDINININEVENVLHIDSFQKRSKDSSEVS